MVTDLDRLHYVVEHKDQLYGARGVGRTFASCHNLAGILGLLEQEDHVWWYNIIWPVPIYKWVDHIRPMLDRVLIEHEIEFNWKNKGTLEAPGARALVRFTTDRDDYLSFKADYIVDTFGETGEHLEWQKQTRLSARGPAGRGRYLHTRKRFWLEEYPEFRARSE